MIFLLMILSAWAAEPAFVFPDGPGRAAVETNCTKCHSGKLVAAQAMTRERWDQTITKMQTTNGLWDLEPPLRKEILDYLETYFSPKALNGMDELGPRRVTPLPE